jgi:hypothetical protein
MGKLIVKESSVDVDDELEGGEDSTGVLAAVVEVSVTFGVGSMALVTWEMTLPTNEVRGSSRSVEDDVDEVDGVAVEDEDSEDTIPVGARRIPEDVVGLLAAAELVVAELAATELAAGELATVELGASLDDELEDELVVGWMTELGTPPVD